METLATLFGAILANLRRNIAPVARQDLARIAIYDLVWLRLNRAANRFAALYAKWKAGTLPQRRMGKRSATHRSATNPPKPPTPNLPTSRNWLVALLGYHAAGFAHHLDTLLHTHPDVPEFLAACPQAARILRPLCHMLGIDPPAPIVPHRHAAVPRPPRPVGRISEASCANPAPTPPPLIPLIYWH